MFRTKRILSVLYFFIWVLVFLGPYLRNMHDLNADCINSMIGDYIHLFLLFLLFLVNLYLLVPKWLFSNKKVQYVILLIITILLITGIDIFIHYIMLSPRNPEFDSGLGHIPTQSPFERGAILGNTVNTLMSAILMVGASNAIELVYKWSWEETRRKDIEKEQLKTNLALLRHQVSPHFFMNTLNNIHALIEINTDKAQDAVVRLSTLMRYLLYDAAQHTIELKKEIAFINSFVSLMQLRHSDEVVVRIITPDQIPDVKIPPMLFISLLENAFKHGVCYPLPSYIHFELQVDQHSLNCTIKNSKHINPAKYEGEYSGMGIDNIKESLKLLYGVNYLLQIHDSANEFEVNLKIPL